MQTTRLSPEAPLQISRIGLGCWALGGGDWAFGWGQQDDADSVATIHGALDRGINWLDTAAVYGLGHAEAVVARALRTLPRSERPFVFTKCGLVWTRGGKVRHRLTPQSIRKEAEESLRRLDTDAIDLYQIHWPVYPPGKPAPALEQAWATLCALKQEGKVRYLGVSNFDVSHLERIRAIAPVATLQPPYSLLRREAEAELFPYCVEHAIGVIVYSPMASGLLSGAMTRERVASLPNDDWRKSKSLDFREPRLSVNLALVERLRTLGRRSGASPARVAVRWTLANPAVQAAIVGARRPEQLDEIVKAPDLELSDEELDGLADQDVRRADTTLSENP